ncbi:MULTISPECIES: YbaB/EbfC family nucleoid-associated protein [unclassified Nonomuraea]|uniref:YbaB/EbfC family nucleoid-associated protein n=1 Tax=unclassified Nonomuraea TaxID=2593643 RepID=UPI0033FC7BE9
MTTPEDPTPYLDDEMRHLLGQFQADIRPLEELQQSLDAVRGRGEAADGRVTAEVLPTGALGGLRIDPRAMRLGADALAEAVLAAANAAGEDLAAQMSGLMTTGLTPFADEVRRFTRD